MVNGVGQGLTALFFTMFALIIIFVPLGIWKLVEIASWLFSHIQWVQ